MADKYRIAIYIRLSMADEETGRKKDESNSVIHQRELIGRFLDDHPELSGCPRMEFVDDGFTGTNTDRPAFRDMVGQIREGAFNLCITKDFSRFSRDYIEMGDYLECLFPFLGVRYISINDHYDSINYKGTTGGLDVVMRNIVYAAYSRDISIKETTGKRQSAKKGRRATGLPAFGYMADPARKAMDVLDPDAAKVVRRIFDEAISGKGVSEIALGLNVDGVPSPSGYYKMRHPDTGKFGYCKDNNAWTYGAVYQILTRYSYTGASVGGIRSLNAPCSRGSHQNKREDWIIVPGMHEAIITQEEYEQAQKVIRKGNPGAVSDLKYPLKSLVVCGICGYSMDRDKKRRYYVCDYGRNDPLSTCKRLRSPGEDEMEEQVLAGIRDKVTATDSSSDKKGSRKYVHPSRKNHKKGTDDADRRVRMAQQRKLEAYEMYCDGLCDKGTYLSVKKRIDDEIERIRNECESKASDPRSGYPGISQTSSAGYRISSLRQLAEDAEHLTYELAHEAVERILVFPDKKIEIKWRI